MNRKIAALASGLILIGGCGGSSSPPPSTIVTSTLSFSLAQAIANFAANNESYPSTLGGTYQGVNGNGSGTATFNAATATTFEGQQAFARVTTISGTISNGTSSASYAGSGTDYYTTDYELLGFAGTDDYCVFQSTADFPASIKVGDTATLPTANCYSDSTKTVSVGTATLSYVVKADTANSAFVDLTENTYNLSGALEASTQSTYRIDEAGTLSPVSIAITDNSTTPGAAFTLTTN